MKTLLLVFAPLTPVCRLHVNAPFGFSLEPSAENTAARKNESVGSVITDDGQFKVAAEWCGRNRLPLTVSLVKRCRPSRLRQRPLPPLAGGSALGLSATGACRPCFGR